jgi:hypothetical protein
MEGEETEEVAIPISNSPHTLRQAKAADPLSTRPTLRENRFPAQSSVSIKLVPLQLVDLPERRQNGQCLLPPQDKPEILEDRVVQIQEDAGHNRRVGDRLSAFGELASQSIEVGRLGRVLLGPFDGSAERLLDKRAVEPQLVLWNYA